MKHSLSIFLSGRAKAATFLMAGLRGGLLGLAGLAVIASSPAFAWSPEDEIQRGYELIDDYLVAKDGNDLTARIYSSAQTSAILIVPADMETPSVILWPRTRQVESLKSMKVQTLAGGFAEVKKAAVAARHAPFEVVGTNVVFDLDGSEMRLRPKPPLLGFFDAPEMLGGSAVYARRAEDYAPSDEVVEKLGTMGDNVRVRVFFGSWCPACGQMVPRILSVAERLAEPESGDAKMNFEFYGLPKKDFFADKEAKALGIKSVPTGVIFVDDKEVGRIQGNDWRSPESALWKLLGSGASAG